MKILKSFLFVVVSAMFIASCGSSKQVTTMQGPTKTKLALDECQELAEAKPATRAWGEGINFRLSRASTYAENQARAQFTRKIRSAVTTTTTEQGFNYDKASTDMKQSAQVRDEGAKGNDFAETIAQEVVQNTAIIKTSQYQNIDGSYQVFVCIEYNGDISTLSSEITNKVQQRISDEERMKMNFEFDQYKKSIEEKLQQYRDSK